MTAAVTNKSLDPSAGLPANLQADSLTGTEVHLILLGLLQQNPTWTQRQLPDTSGISLGKTNYCLRAFRDKGLIKWGNFSQNPSKFQYMHLLTPRGIAQKLCLTTHFLQCKDCEFEELGRKITRLRAELGKNNPNPFVAIPPPGETALNARPYC